MKPLHKRTLFTIAGCLVVVCVRLLWAQSSDTADWEKAAGGKMSFEVASVKPNDSGPGLWASPNSVFGNSVFGLGDKQAPNGVLRATNVPLIVYIAFAYKLDPTETRVVTTQLPQWTRRTFYDIEAQPPGSNFTSDQVRLMTQSLLADRFKLAVHFETKDGPAYALVFAKAGKLGPQMQPYPDGFPCSEAQTSGGGRGRQNPVVPTVADGQLPASCGYIQPMPLTETGFRHEAGRNIEMASIVDWITLAGSLDRPLVDRTGLTGTFDVTMEYARPVTLGADSLGGTTFLEAMPDQLGLKLQSITAPVRSLTVDHIEQLTPN